jgi:hypothetical protein
MSCLCVLSVKREHVDSMRSLAHSLLSATSKPPRTKEKHFQYGDTRDLLLHRADVHGADYVAAMLTRKESSIY